MAHTYRTRPSRLLGIEDAYAAWCLDQAIAEYIVRVKAGHRLRPAATSDNKKLIDQMRKRQGRRKR